MYIVNNRIKGVIVCLTCFLIVMLAGCSTPGKNKGPGGASSAAQSQSGITLDSINVVGNGDAILVEAGGPINFTAKKQSNPSAIIIDLPGVDVTGLTSPMVVNNGFITEIVLTQSNSLGTVEIGLQDGVGYDIKDGEDSLLVDLKRDIFISGETGEEEEVFEEDLMVADAEEDVESVEDAPVFVEEEIAEDEVLADDLDSMGGSVEEEVEEVPEPVVASVEAEKEAESIIANTLDPATRLISVKTEVDRSGTTVKIKGDGMVANYNTFGLDNPARLVVDVWDVKSNIKRKEYGIGGPHIDKVRVGKHSDKVRFVFDSSLSKLANHKIRKDGEYLVVQFFEEGLEPVDIPVEPEPVSVAQVDSVVEDDYEAEETIDIDSLEEEDSVSVEDDIAMDMSDDESDEEDAVVGGGGDVAYKVRDISFDVSDGVATLRVKRSGKSDYKTSESLDGKTILIDIKDTVVPEDLRMVMDATALGTPVVSISSYQGSHKNANLLVKMATKTLYDISEDGTSILVDFILDEASGIGYRDPDGIGGSLFGGQRLNEEGLPEKTYTGRKIDLEMVNVEVVDVIDFIAEVSNFNIITSGVQGQITLRLKDVPWDQAFDLILSTEGLDKIQEGNIIRVAPSAQIRKQKEDVLAAIAATEKLEPTVTEFIRINYDKAGSLIGQISSLLSDRGNATAHETTNTLIIKDTPKSIDSIREFLEQVDIPTPQVLIEARIVEASSNFARDLGVQWGFDTQTGSTGDKVHTALYGGSAGGAATYNPTTAVQFPTKGPIQGTTNYAVSLPASGGAGTLGSIGMLLGKSGANPLALELKLSAGEAEGQIKTISRPRIITMDGKAAEISQGETIPFETSDASGSSATKFINAGLGLKVTPQITPDGSIILKIDAENNSLGSFVTSAGEPSINEKQAKTEVLVRDGETTVIGGVIVSTETQSERGVPFLKDLPLIGWLFRTRSIADSQSELLIFITPTIIRESAR